MKKTDAIIFDLDGTLWNPTEMCLAAWNDVLSTKDNTITKEEIESIFGMKFNLIGAKIFPDLSSRECESLMNECMAAEEKYIRSKGGILYPNLISVLDTLSKIYKLCIVSNCQAGYIEAFLDYYGLHSYFTDIECAGNTSLDKGENIKLVIDRNDFKNPIYIGDTEGDRKAALYCNIPFIFATYGFGRGIESSVSITELNELLTLF